LVALHLKNLLSGITTSFLAHFYIPSSAPLVAVGHQESAYLTIDFDQYRVSIQADPDHTTLDICEHLVGEPGEDIISMIPVLTTSINLAPIHDFRAIRSDNRKARQIEMPLDHWKTIFQALPSLASLTLTLPTSWMRVAFQALHPNESAAGPILCPELTQLHLKANTADPAGAWALDGVVVECLKARSRCGVGPLEILVMNFGEDSAIDELKAIVAQVDRQ